MCTRYSLNAAAAAQVAALLQLETPPPPKDEIFPADKTSVVQMEGGKLCAVKAAFGFLSSHGKNLVLNARSETLAQKPMFAPALRAGRAVVPAGAFFEWSHTAPKTKYAFFAQNKAPLLMAGLVRRQQDGLHYVVITRQAVAPVADIHDRMPVLFTPAQARAWLLNGDTEGLLNAPPPPLLRALPDDAAPRQTCLF